MPVSTAQIPAQAACAQDRQPIEKNSLWDELNIQKGEIVCQGNFGTTSKVGLGAFSAGVREIFRVEMEKARFPAMK
jgi:hypothetical protein